MYQKYPNIQNFKFRLPSESLNSEIIKMNEINLDIKEKTRAQNQ